MKHTFAKKYRSFKALLAGGLILIFASCSKSEEAVPLPASSPPPSFVVSRFQSVYRVKYWSVGNGDTTKYVFDYNANGTINQIIEFLHGDTLYVNEFRHTPSYSVRYATFVRIASPQPRKLDSLLYDEQGRPMEAYINDDSKPYARYTYGTDGKLEYTIYPFSQYQNNVKSYWDNDDLVQTDTGKYAILRTFYTENIVRIGDAQILENMFRFGRVWMTNSHLIKSSFPVSQRDMQYVYAYTFANNRVTHLIITNPSGVLLSTYLFTYQN